MINPSALVELAERVEAATGPDRKLDYAIHDCLGTLQLTVSAFCPDPGYTTSLDAAWTLVPEDAYVRAHVAPDGISDILVGGTQCTGATPALALCAAALKARSTQGTNLQDTPAPHGEPRG